MKKKKKEFTPEEKLSRHNRGFVKGRPLTTAGEKQLKKNKYAAAINENSSK